MTFEEIEQFAQSLLRAWSSRNLATVMALYAEDCLFIDPAVPGGLKGREALAAYCEDLFAKHPGNQLNLDEVWELEGGFCMRWYADVDEGRRVRGFELILLDDGLIVHEEGYYQVL